MVLTRILLKQKRDFKPKNAIMALALNNSWFHHTCKLIKPFHENNRSCLKDTSVSRKKQLVGFNKKFMFSCFKFNFEND